MTEQSYEPPTITEVGSLHDVTLAAKVLRRTDGFTFQGANIGGPNDPIAS